MRKNPNFSHKLKILRNIKMSDMGVISLNIAFDLQTDYSIKKILFFLAIFVIKKTSCIYREQLLEKTGGLFYEFKDIFY